MIPISSWTQSLRRPCRGSVNRPKTVWNLYVHLRRPYPARRAVHSVRHQKNLECLGSLGSNPAPPRWCAGGGHPWTPIEGQSCIPIDNHQKRPAVDVSAQRLDTAAATRLVSQAHQVLWRSNSVEILGPTPDCSSSSRRHGAQRRTFARRGPPHRPLPGEKVESPR